MTQIDDALASRVRWFSAFAGALFLGFFVVSVYRHGTTATDENLFRAPSSPAYLMSAVTGTPTALAPGDLLLTIDDTRIDTVTTLTGALARAGRTVDVVAQRTATGEEIRTQSETTALSRAAIEDVSHGALVVAVTPGGASYRAGMEVGDVILRINGQSFRDIREADAIMRKGATDRATAYDVLRAGTSVRLHVTLAAFGLRMSLLLVALVALLWMTVGLGLVLARPGLKGARYMGWTLLAFGYGIGLSFIPRAPLPGRFETFRDVTMLLAMGWGLASWIHARLYFPRERPVALARTWLLPVAYGTAIVGTLLLAIRPTNGLALTLTAAMVILGLVGTYVPRAQRTAESEQVARPLRRATWFGCGLTFVALTLTNSRLFEFDPTLFAIPLILVPLATLHTIARFRLLDLDLRVRRSVQYSLTSTAWIVLVVGIVLAMLAWLPTLEMQLPHVRMSGTSVEVLDEPMADAERAAHEKGVLMMTAIGLAFAARAIGRRGLDWIAGRFHRSEHDYRRASKDLAALTASRLDLHSLADGLIDTIVALMPLKRAGVIFIHGNVTYTGHDGHGFSPDAWQAFCASSTSDIVQGIDKAEEEVHAEYTFPRLRRALSDVELYYLYPIRSHDKLVGVILMGEKRSEAAYYADDFEFVGAIARQVAPAIDNAFLYEDLAGQERMKHELAIARRIQLESLPQFTPAVNGLDIAGRSVPAMEVGGDYFDYLNGTPSRLTVMVGDVSGKGTSAALYMSKLQGILRSLHAFDLTPRELFLRTNRLLCQDLERRSFVTALGGFFDMHASEVTLARAGHLPLYYYDSQRKRVERLLPGGLGFGLSQRDLFGDELQEQRVSYHMGDAFLFVTDGITECMSPDGEEFGEQRLMDLFAESAAGPASASALRDQIFDAVHTFTHGSEQADDQTVVVVRATH